MKEIINKTAAAPKIAPHQTPEMKLLSTSIAIKPHHVGQRTNTVLFCFP
jgi:hypothetical protein